VVVPQVEANRFEEFPAMAYLRGFLKGYCDYLEVDFDALWKQIVPETNGAPAPAGGKPGSAAAAKPGSAPAPSAAPAPAPAAKSPTPVPAPKAATPKPEPARREPPPAPAPAAHAPHASHAPHGSHGAHSEAAPAAAGSGAAAGIAIAVAAAAVVAAIFVLGPSVPKAPEPKPEEPAVQAPAPAALQPLKPAAEPQLTIVFRRDMWVSISVDGVEKFQGRVPQGAKQEWKGKRELSLRASDPEALKLTLNGSAYTLPTPAADGTYRIEGP
jgi:cytoskeletal protein RodZ